MKKKNIIENIKFKNDEVADSLEERRDNSQIDDNSINMTAATKAEKNLESKKT